jgi:hypothetical protein
LECSFVSVPRAGVPLERIDELLLGFELELELERKLAFESVRAGAVSLETCVTGAPFVSRGSPVNLGC